MSSKRIEMLHQRFKKDTSYHTKTTTLKEFANWVCNDKNDPPLSLNSRCGYLFSLYSEMVALSSKVTCIFGTELNKNRCLL